MIRNRKNQLHVAFACILVFLIGSILVVAYSWFRFDEAEVSAHYYNAILRSGNGLTKELYIKEPSQESALLGVQHETATFLVSTITQNNLLSSQPFKDCDVLQENVDCSQAEWRGTREGYFTAVLTKYADKQRHLRTESFVLYIDKTDGHLSIEHARY